MSSSRQRSSSLFDCPVERLPAVDKSRELLFLRLEQMNNATANAEINNDHVVIEKKKESPSNKGNRSKSILIQKETSGRPRRSSVNVPRGFTDDMIYMADVAGSYECTGRIEKSSSPTVDLDFVPPHLSTLEYETFPYH